MARKAQVRYFKSRGAYYCQMDGRQHKLAVGPDDCPLGPTYDAAVKAYRRLLEGQTSRPAAMDTKVGYVIARYVDWLKTRRRASTAAHREVILKPFVQHCGELAAGDLSEVILLDFQERMAGEGRLTKQNNRRKWGKATLVLFRKVVHACFAWAARPVNKLIPSNPLSGLETGTIRSRGREAVITHEIHERLVKRARGDLKEILRCLEDSGCRPGELLGVTAADWDSSRDAFFLHVETARRAGEAMHKTGEKKERQIVFTRAVTDMLKARMRRHPSGPLFFTATGKPWSVRVLSQWFARARKALGIPRLITYSYRHTFATRWLTAGKSIDVLAALMGNSPAVIRAHYSHLLVKSDPLRAALEAFKGSQSEPANSSPDLRLIG